MKTKRYEHYPHGMEESAHGSWVYVDDLPPDVVESHIEKETWGATVKITAKKYSGEPDQK